MWQRVQQRDLEASEPLPTETWFQGGCGLVDEPLWDVRVDAFSHASRRVAEQLAGHLDGYSLLEQESGGSVSESVEADAGCTDGRDDGPQRLAGVVRVPERADVGVTTSQVSRQSCPAVSRCGVCSSAQESDFAVVVFRAR